jgi:hypothetical protein
VAEILHTAVATSLLCQAIVHKRISNASGGTSAPHPLPVTVAYPAPTSRPGISERGRALPWIGNDGTKPEWLLFAEERRSPWSVAATALHLTCSTISPTSPRNSCGAMPSIVLSTPPLRATPTPRTCLEHGACTFLFNPASSPISEPACWRADVCPFVLRIDGSFASLSAPAPTLEHELAPQSDRYLVVRRDVGAHRIELGTDLTVGAPRAQLPLDAFLGLRLACLQAYASGRSEWSARLRPTAYQSGRLALMLAILDWRDDAENASGATRAIAAELVFPGAKLPRRAIEWKSSSFRRQTQRIVAAAQSMCSHGFRRLLHGQTSIAT